jgi:rhodanese-related sulfurtransferase
MDRLLQQSHIDSDELVQLLEERKAGRVEFVLVDVREPYEYDAGHIKGVDLLKPTSSFQSWAEEFLVAYKDKTVIFTCRTDHRSGSVQQIFQQNGMRRAINHLGGIVSYQGEIER